MERRRTRSGRRERRVGRETAAGLLRQPAVWAVLAMAAVGQVGASAAAAKAAHEPIRLPPVVVSEPAPRSSVAMAWQEKALERAGDQVAAQLRAHGYSISSGLERAIDAAAKENGIDPKVAFGLVKTESSFKNSATSHVGAVGLTQLMPNTASWMAPGTTRRDLRDPETNLRIGFKYLRYLLDRYDGDTALALTAYNRGPGTVDRVLKRGGDPDNGYAEMVMGD